MDVIIEDPKNIPATLKPQLIDLVVNGGQVARKFVEPGISRAILISIMIDREVIASTATIKNPLDSYRQGVFESANAIETPSLYPLEIGYIVTREEYEGNKLCPKLISDLMPKLANQNIFATTRKPAMIHILKKFRFRIIGQEYKDGLYLLVYNGN
jgi:hypothetical protein